jgi:hemerythrin-like metal-binding protein
MTTSAQSAEFVTGYPPLDLDHQEFLALLDSLAAATDSDFPELYKQLYAMTEQHFERENQLMQDYAFPALTEHKAEHQRVLGEFKQFQSRINKGLVVFGRLFVTDRLPLWFKLHVATMDYAFVNHIQSQTPH